MRKKLIDLPDTEWTVDYQGELGPSVESIKVGAILRIAKSVEIQAQNSNLMAKNFLALQETVEFLRKRGKEQADCIESQRRTISALKGQITKLKKRI